MAKKLELSPDLLKSISAIAANTYKIEMLRVGQLVPNEENFFEISDIETLAEDIERQGLKHNLVVVPCDGDRYKIISGHRRFAAIKYLKDSNRYKSELVPCYIDNPAASAAEQKLNLIMLNATSREMSDADKLNEYRELQEAFAALKLEGKKIPGKMRDKIAAAMNVSPATVGKFETIEKSNSNIITKAIAAGKLSINAAAKLSKLPLVRQKEYIKKLSAGEMKLSEVDDYEAARREEYIEKQRASNKSEKGRLYRPEINDIDTHLPAKSCNVVLNADEVMEIITVLPDFLPTIAETEDKLYKILKKIIGTLTEQADEMGFEDEEDGYDL